jgi:hypothetical protein
VYDPSHLTPVVWVLPSPPRQSGQGAERRAVERAVGRSVGLSAVRALGLALLQCAPTVHLSWLSAPLPTAGPTAAGHAAAAAVGVRAVGAAAHAVDAAAHTAAAHAAAAHTVQVGPCGTPLRQQLRQELLLCRAGLAVPLR